jgi:hypothetical protein
MTLQGQSSNTWSGAPWQCHQSITATLTHLHTHSLTHSLTPIRHCPTHSLTHLPINRIPNAKDKLSPGTHLLHPRCTRVTVDDLGSLLPHHTHSLTHSLTHSQLIPVPLRAKPPAEGKELTLILHIHIRVLAECSSECSGAGLLRSHDEEVHIHWGVSEGVRE